MSHGVGVVLLVRTGLQLEIGQFPPTQPVEYRHMAGQQLVDFLKNTAAGSTRRAQGEQLPQAVGAHHRLHAGKLQQPLDFRREHQPPLPQGVEQGLHAEPVPAQNRALLQRVVHGKGENPVELFRAARPPGQVGGQHHLGVAGRLKGEAPALQLPAQFGGVVHLAVVRDGNLAALPGKAHGLVSVFWVHDGQAGVSHPVDSRKSQRNRT